MNNVNPPGGTFANCYKFHKQALDYSGPEGAEWYEWMKPGFGLVKWVDYRVDAGEDPPVVYQLQSSTVPAP